MGKKYPGHEKFADGRESDNRRQTREKDDVPYWYGI